MEPYFCLWSRLYLRRWQPLTIVVTGSVAKTNLLYILGEQLGEEAAYSYRANTKIGIACDILNLAPISEDRRRRWLLLIVVSPFKALFAKVRPEEKYLVEYDAYDMVSSRYFKWWLRPNVCLWTTVSESHLQNFEKAAKKKNLKTFDLVVSEFAKIVQSADQHIFAPADNRFMKQSLKGVQTPVSWLKDELLEYGVDSKGTVFKFKDIRFVFSHPLPKEMSHILTLAAGLMGYLKQAPRTDLRDWQPPPGRSSLLRGYKGCHLIDSSYNAQYEAVLAILAMFESFKAQEKWLVFGDMIEQGDFTRKAHLEVADKILELDLKKVFLVGRRTKKYIYPILKEKYPNLHWTNKADKDLILHLKRGIKGGEVILFKGAGVLDILVEALLKNPADNKFLNNPGRLDRVLKSSHDKS